MENKPEDKISQAEERLEVARFDLANTYLLEIQTRYQSSDAQQREALLCGLEKLAKGSYPAIQRTNNSAFDGVKAREVRKKQGLSLRALAKELKVPYTSLIWNYETGRNHPSNPPVGETAKAYLQWLKKHEYDPFKLNKQED
jgi:DNA-binding transcriptional regulator YiaG